jgi:hypothetical protein
LPSNAISLSQKKPDDSGFSERSVPAESAIGDTLASFLSSIGMGAEDAPAFGGISIGDSETEVFSTTTSSDVPVTIATIAVPSAASLGLNGYVVARRTGGSSGNTGDGAYYKIDAVHKNVGGNAMSIGTTVNAIGESQPGWDVAIAQAGDSIVIQVSGAENNNVSWMAVITRNPV